MRTEASGTSDTLSPRRDPATQHPKTAKVTPCCAPLRKVAASAFHPGYRGASFLSQPSTTHPYCPLTITLPLNLLTIHSCGQLPTVACSSCFDISSQADPPGQGTLVGLSKYMVLSLTGPHSTLVPKPARPYRP